MIVGLAGHIDHGKTALVKALTGVAGDRLKDEKARGITIDLGFAYMPTRSGQPIGFIDVPGHERFVHTMLAGASGVDFALLTIAVDDGIMPQTLEHLAILDLLGIDRGVVVLTKADLASPERYRECGAAGESHDRGDSAGACRDPDGLGADRRRAWTRCARISKRRRARCAIARQARGFGLRSIASSRCLASASWRPERCCRARSTSATGSSSAHPACSRACALFMRRTAQAEAAHAGERCALNLTGPGITKDAIRRGDVALDPELHAPTDRIDARIRVLPTEKKPIGQWFPVRLHHASAEAGARIVLFDDKPIAPGEAADVQLVLDRPIAAAAHDRFVVRDVSAQRTLGGGVFLDLRAKAPEGGGRRRGSAQRAALALADPSASFAALLETPPFAFDLAAFARDRALSAERKTSSRRTLGLVILEAGDSRIALTRERWALFASTHARADRGLSRRKSGSSRLGTRTAAGHVAAKTSEAGIRRRLEKACRLRPTRSGRRVRQTSVARGAACARG